MLFYVLLIMPFMPMLVWSFTALFIEWNEPGPSLVVCFLLTMGLTCIPMGVWGDHASDLSKISSQQQLIDAYEKEVQDLNTRLSSFNFPEGALLNADTPVASIVKNISVWQEKLANARAERAIAIRSIEARRNGPFSSVIEFVGK